MALAESRTATHLTWGIEVSGADFIHKASSYGAFGPDKSLLEIGPGYGRLLKSIIDQNLPFKSYLGVEPTFVTTRNRKSCRFSIARTLS
jgi:tRNA G46 methylase TrmB